MSYVKPDVSGRIYQNRLNFVNRYLQPSLDKIGSNIGPSPPLLRVPRLRSFSPLYDSLPQISPEKSFAPITQNFQDFPSLGIYDRSFITPNIILNPSFPQNRYRDIMIKQLSPDRKLFVEPIDLNLSQIKPVANEPIYTQTIGIPRRRFINYDTGMARTSSNFLSSGRRSFSNSNLNFLKPNLSFYYPRESRPLTRYYRSSSNYPRRYIPLVPKIYKKMYEASPIVKQHPGGKIYSNYKNYDIHPRTIFVSRYNPEPAREQQISFVNIPRLSPSLKYKMMSSVPVYYEHELNPISKQSYLTSSPNSYQPKLTLIDTSNDNFTSDNGKIVEN